MTLARDMVVLFFVAIILTIALYYYYGGVQYIKAFAQAGSTLAQGLTNFKSSYPTAIPGAA